MNTPQPNTPKSKHPLNYGFAVGLVLLAVIVRFFLSPLLGDHPFVFFLGIVMASAWYGGFGPGLFATILSAAASLYFFIDRNEMSHGLSDYLGLSIFVVEGVVISALTAQRTRALTIVEKSRAELGQRVRERTAQLTEANELLKQEADERKQSQARLAGILEQLPVGVLFRDEHGRYTHANQRVCDILGLSKEDIIGKQAEELNALVNPTEPSGSSFREGKIPSSIALRTREPVAPVELLIAPQSGTTRRVTAAAAPVVLEPGLTGAVSVIVDITEQHALTEQLRQAQKMEAVGQLAGGIAHDFNNLLTAITGYSELSLRRLGADDPHRRNLEEIKKAADRAASLTRQLLAFSRKQILEPKVVNLNSIVDSTEKMLRRLIGENIEVSSILEPELWLVKADPSQIEQILMNLVVNARDAMPDGGKLTIETANVELDQNYAGKHVMVSPGPYVMLAVSDTGIGMDAETEAHIFEPFFTTKEIGKGTGLGLSTVYGIVKQSGGYVWVYSEVGQGTTFKVYLPREFEPESAFVKSESRSIARGTETVLLVEDDDMVRNLAREVLESNGYRVLVASEATEALTLCENSRGEIKLVLTDVVMPQMGGKELAARLLQNSPDLKVLYMSGYTDNAIVHHGVLDESVSFLQKPFTPDALAKKVREVLDES